MSVVHDLSDLRHLQEQVKKNILLPKIFLTFHCLKKLFQRSQNVCKFSAFSSFKIFSRSLQQFFLIVGQNNFGNKIPFLSLHLIFFSLENKISTKFLTTFIFLGHKYYHFLYGKRYYFSFFLVPSPFQFLLAL